MATPIKVGLIRCDTHGAYFAPLMAPHDPYKFMQPVPWRPKLPHTWLNGGMHRYFYGNLGDPTQMTVPHHFDFEFVKCWDESREVAEAFSALMDRQPRVCDSYEEASDGVDLVFIGECNGIGDDHLKLSTPALERGIAIFIDKPLAHNTKDVKAIVALAKKRNTPVFSASILRHLPTADQFRQRLPELGEHIEGGNIAFRTWNIAGFIHSVSLAQSAFGNGITAVQAMGPGEMDVARLSWGEREDRPRSGVVLHHIPYKRKHIGTMFLAAYGPEGFIATEKINEWYFPIGAANIVKLISEMVRTRQIPETMDDMIEAVAAVNAGQLSAKEGGRLVRLEEVQ
jgi:predicted dehydrogenase